jgi:hypothetical protein
MGMKRRRRFMFQSEGFETAAYSLTAEEKSELEDAARDFNKFLAEVRSGEQVTYSIDETEALHEKLTNAGEIFERLALTTWENWREHGAVQHSVDEDEEV